MFIEHVSTGEVPTLALERRLAGMGGEPGGKSSEQPSEQPGIADTNAHAAADVIVGFDEVGRGALAGPVMVGAAAIWARDLGHLSVPTGLADSKMLTERRREALFEPLRAWCAASAVGAASNAEIDEWGIAHALGIAALRALAQVERQLMRSATAIHAVAGILDGPNDYITKAMDTFDAPDVPFPATITTLVKGDRHCATVAAAAVIAKVTRDRLMSELAASDPRYAPYEWDRNKGYGSRAHRAAIAACGPSDMHRISWHLV